MTFGGELETRTRRRAGVIMTFLTTVLGVMLALAGGTSIAKDVISVRRYETARNAFVTQGDDEDEVDWDGLKATNADVVAWLKVTGTEIDLPVCQASDDDPEFYLHHDLWRNYEFTGCPYVDHRCTADGPHVLVFGHHMNSGGMFSELFQCFRQEEFDRVLGSATMVWSTPDSGSIVMRPVCAMEVDQSYEDIQWFEFDNVSKMEAWLVQMDQAATAHAESREGVIMTADRIVTLVTCSSLFGGQRTRTLVIFAGSL